MPPRFKSPAPRPSPSVSAVRLRPRHPPVSVADLALMLELDLLMGNRADFVARLQAALNAAALPDNAQKLPLAANIGMKRRASSTQGGCYDRPQ